MKTEYYILTAEGVNECVIKLKPTINDAVKTLALMTNVRKAFKKSAQPTEIGDINDWRQDGNYCFYGTAIEVGDNTEIDFSLTPITVV